MFGSLLHLRFFSFSQCSRRRNPSDAVRDLLLLFFPFSVSVIDWNVIDDLIPVGEDPEEDSKADSVEKNEESDSTFENSTIAVTSTAEIMEEPPNKKTHIDRSVMRDRRSKKTKKDHFQYIVV
ncbi:unnamed protein product [Camellia sinensis]